LELKHTAARSVFWSVLEYGSGALISFFSLIFIAKILGPSDFGVFSIAWAVVEIAALLTTMLFHDALIQKRDVTDEHFDSALTVSILLSLVAYALLWLSFPILAHFASDERIAVVGRVVGLGVLATGPVGILDARQSREFGFRVLAVRTLVGRAGGVSLGLLSALAGFGIWSLVVQVLTGTLFSAIALVLYSPWKVRLTRNIGPVRDLLGYSVASFGSLAATFVSKRIFVLSVGIFLGTEEAGLFNLAFRMVDSAWSIAAAALSQVLLPTLSRLQGDRVRLINAYRVLLKLATSILYPVFGSLAILGPYFLEFVFGRKWEAASSYVLVLSLLTYLQVPRLPATPLLSATGSIRDVCLINIFVLAFVLGAIGLTRLHTDYITLVVWSSGEFVASALIAALLNIRLGISVVQQIIDLLVPLAASVAMIAVFLVTREVLPGHIGVFGYFSSLSLAGAATYFGLILLFGRQYVEPVVGMARAFLTSDR
jgi:PST family polysaccharide transporter